MMWSLSIPLKVLIIVRQSQCRALKNLFGLYILSRYQGKCYLKIKSSFQLDLRVIMGCPAGSVSGAYDS